MELRALLTRFQNWLRKQFPSPNGDFDQPTLSDDGLIIHDQSPPANASPLQTVAVRGKPEMEKFQAGFETLIDQIKDINDHLNKQVSQHENLIARIEQFPKLLENFPAVVENQKALTEQLVLQLKANILKDQQLLSAIEKIPVESAKQTDALMAIDRQLAAAADAVSTNEAALKATDRALGKAQATGSSDAGQISTLTASVQELTAELKIHTQTVAQERALTLLGEHGGAAALVGGVVANQEILKHGGKLSADQIATNQAFVELMQILGANNNQIIQLVQALVADQKNRDHEIAGLRAQVENARNNQG